MKSIFIVTNPDDTILGVFDSEEKGNNVKELSKMWDETWYVVEYDLNTIPMWLVKDQLKGIKLKVGKDV